MAAVQERHDERHARPCCLRCHQLDQKCGKNCQGGADHGGRHQRLKRACVFNVVDESDQATPCRGCNLGAKETSTSIRIAVFRTALYIMERPTPGFRIVLHQVVAPRHDPQLAVSDGCGTETRESSGDHRDHELAESPACQQTWASLFSRPQLPRPPSYEQAHRSSRKSDGHPPRLAGT